MGQLPTLHIMKQFFKPGEQAFAARIQCLLQDGGIGEDEVRRRYRVDHALHLKAQAFLFLAIHPIDFVSQPHQMFGGERVALPDGLENRVLIP